MAKYVLAFRGGGMPESEEAQAQVMQAWDAWFRELGAAVVDPGNPTSRGRTIRADGSVEPEGPATLSGYTIIQADDLDAAVELAKGCPVLASGASIDLAEVVEVM